MQVPNFFKFCFILFQVQPNFLQIIILSNWHSCDSHCVTCASTFPEHLLRVRIQTQHSFLSLTIAYRVKRPILSPFYKENWTLKKVSYVSKITQLGAPGCCLDAQQVLTPLPGAFSCSATHSLSASLQSLPKAGMLHVKPETVYQIVSKAVCEEGTQISKGSVIPRRLRTSTRAGCQLPHFPLRSRRSLGREYLLYGETELWLPVPALALLC